MKATGIVRRIDDLGRVVIPKEIRRTMRIREGDPLEIFIEKDGEVIFKKYSPIGELSQFAGQYTDALQKTTGQAVAICDRDGVIAVSGAPRRELVDKRLSGATERLLESRQPYRAGAGEQKKIPFLDSTDRYYVGVCVPVISQGDLIGGVLFLSPETGQQLTDVELKLAQAAANFLGSHMEG